MTAPACVDPASEVITATMNALRAVYAADSVCPPLGGSTDKVAFIAADMAPLDEIHCSSPLLWVRLAGRHRSQVFPDPSVAASPCGGLDVIVLEVGVARCADLDPSYSAKATEAEVALDDTWRLSRALCMVSGQLRTDHQVGYDSIIPYGPEGGVIAWTALVYISV